MNNSSQLFRLTGSDGRQIILTDKMTIGRLSDCQIQVLDKLASRHHAVIEIINQRAVLTDLSSNNGTWLNEQKVSAPTELRNGDHLRIGDTVFIFKSPDLQAEKETPDLQTMTWQTATLMTLVRGSDGAEFGLSRSMRIGRDPSNEVALTGDSSASQFHALIELHEGRAVISDMNSGNGTWLNGKRVAVKTYIRHGDKIRIGNTIFRLRIGDQPLPALDSSAAPKKSALSASAWVAIFLVGAALLFACIVGIPTLMLLTANDSTPTSQTSPTSDGMDAASITQAKQKALRSLALILVPDQNYEENGWSSGSGSFINEEGYILTNFHVLGYTEHQAQENGRKTGELINTLHNGEEFVLVGINWASPIAEPDTFYRCEIVKTDPYLDLALLRVVQLYDMDTDTLSPLPADLSFPVIAVGNSDQLNILEPITIIGYPGVGGNTPTAIDDQVAGFSPDNDYNIQNGWIKTGPVIGHGNSGGMAINQHGELIGVPTQIIYNQTDKIGYIRPINLALSMIKEFLP